MTTTVQRRALLGSVTALIVLPALLPAQPPPTPATPQNLTQHDGRRDFDFEVGTWKAHVKKLVHPLTGSQQWDDFYGTVVTRPVLSAGWNESEMNVDSPTSHTHLELLAVRLYDPGSHQWSIYGANIRSGVFDPPQVGQFDNGHGEFYAQDAFAGRAVYIRFEWRSINADATHFEQAFSVDGGRTWEVNWIYDGARAKE